MSNSRTNAKYFARLFLTIILVMIVGAVLRYCNNTLEVAHKEYSPEALLKKYEYFKNASSAIDSYRADIEMRASVLKQMSNKESDNYMMSQQELMGIITEYNNMCSDYNSAMSKFNYAFCNKGDMPLSNLKPLPREFKPYMTSLGE